MTMYSIHQKTTQTRVVFYSYSTGLICLKHVISNVKINLHQEKLCFKPENETIKNISNGSREGQRHAAFPRGNIEDIY
jgi:hypothetical protein